MQIKASTAYTINFVTNDSTGAAADADSTPSATLYANATDTSLTVTVAAISGKTGCYSASFTTGADISSFVGKTAQLLIEATIDSVASKAFIPFGQFSAKLIDDLKDFDHANDEVISNVTKILGSSLVESDDGQVALGLSEFFDVETPAKDINDIGAVTLTDEQATALATSIAGGLVDQDGEAGDGKIRLDANGNVYTVNNNNEMYKG